MDDRTFRDHLDRLKKAVDPADIAAGLGLSGRGRRFYCPNCQPTGGKTPDLALADAGFICHKCGQHGDVVDFVVLAGRMTKSEAIAYLESRSGLVRPGGRGRGPAKQGIVDQRPRQPRQTPERVKVGDAPSDLYDAFLKTVGLPLAGTVGGTYLAKRGIDPAVADRLGVRFVADLSGLWDLAGKTVIKAAGLSSLYCYQKERLPFLVIPYLSGGRPVFIKSRCLLSKTEADDRAVPRFLNTGRTVPCLWNHDAIQSADRVLICEGEIDAMTAIMAGYVGVGSPGASAWKDDWSKDFAGKEVILALDADDAGRKGAKVIAKSFDRAGLPPPKELAIPEGQDLNDFFNDGKKE